MKDVKIISVFVFLFVISFIGGGLIGYIFPSSNDVDKREVLLDSVNTNPVLGGQPMAMLPSDVIALSLAGNVEHDKVNDAAIVSYEHYGLDSNVINYCRVVYLYNKDTQLYLLQALVIDSAYHVDIDEMVSVKQVIKL
jgi:hypothetical protein